MTPLSRRGLLRAGMAGAGGGLLGPVATASAGTRAPVSGAAAAAPRTATTGDGTDPVVLAQEMLRHDTSHTGAGGTTLPFAQMLAAKWQAVGVPTEFIPTPKADNVHFIARVGGSGAHPPLLLMSHSDVVTVEREHWSRDPYGGEIVGDWLYGRGSVDMKGTGSAFMAALLRHVREGARFDRDVIYLADCDEEGGPYGARWLVDNHYDKVAAGVAISEGGWLLAQRDGVSPMLASLSVRDRTSLLAQVVASGTATHSSHPDEESAISRLGHALGVLSRYRAPVRLPRLVRDYFGVLADATHDPQFATAIRRLVGASGQRERDRFGAEVVRLSSHPWIHNSLLRTTLSFVGQSAGYYSSIIPSTAVADVRIGFVPDGDDPGTVVADLRRLLGRQEVQLRLVTAAGQTEEELLDRVRRDLGRPESRTDTDVFRMWRPRRARCTRGAYRAVAVRGEYERRSVAGSRHPRLRPVPVRGRR